MSKKPIVSSKTYQKQSPKRKEFLNAAHHIRSAQQNCLEKYGFTHISLITEWEQIIGQTLADYTRPLKLTRARNKKAGGTLYLGISPAHALEAQHMLPILIERINTYYGYGAIQRIILRQMHLPPKLPKNSPKPLELSKNQEIALKKTLQPIQNDRLKAALSKMGTHILLSK